MWRFASLVAVLLAVPPVSAPPDDAGNKALPRANSARPAWCTSRYASNFAALSQAAARVDTKPEGQFTYCVRVTATYECLSYGGDGNVRRTRHTSVAHGTAFAFRRKQAETLLMTAQHVTENPAVTGDDQPVTGVPRGCKKVSDTMVLVDNDKDTFTNDDVPLTRVQSDVALDAAVLRARTTKLNVMPWKVGRSASLHERNVVDVRGFPLGAFKATTQGTVISTYDRDNYKDWDHDDFVVDAALSAGNSGSPVLAVSCESGEFELVGIFHADYSHGNSLNVVVHVDGLRDLMAGQKSSVKNAGGDPSLEPFARQRLADELARAAPFFFPFGPVPASVRLDDQGALVFDVYTREFPYQAWPVTSLEDLPPDGEGFGRPGRIWFGSAQGSIERAASTLGPEGRELTERALGALRESALLALAYRKATAAGPATREAADATTRIDRTVRRAAARHRELALQLAELAEDLTRDEGSGARAAAPVGPPELGGTGGPGKAGHQGGPAQP